jgi:hypothetical protein
MNAQIAIKPSLIAALAAALPELESAKKNKANPAFKSKYADLAAVNEAIEPVSKHGLWYRQHTHENENGVMVETFYIHASGEEKSAGCVFMPATKRDAQGFGSALTYARRYGLQTAFGLATEDDDGNAAVRASQGRQSEPAPDLADRNTVTQMIGLCEAVGGNQAQIICDAYKVSALSELNTKQAAGAIKRLNEKLAERAKAIQDANAKAGFGEILDDEVPY